MALIETSVKEKIGYITLNRPEKLNSLTAEMTKDLIAAIIDFRENPDVWVAILHGRGRAFCTGFDLNEVAASTVLPKRVLLEIFQTFKPIISAINGHCLAQGAGLALACDIIIAAEDLQLGWPHVKRGISSMSGASMGAHELPLNIAFEHLFTGELLDAQEAQRHYLVNKVVPNEMLLTETERMAMKIAANAPLAVSAMKEAAMLGLDMPRERRIGYAARMLAHSLQTEDAKEGVSAFLEKRQPVWKGK